MITLEEARQKICAVIEPLPAEGVAVGQSLNRIAAERVVAGIDLPVFDNSAMDGYAVRAADLEQATPGARVGLSCIGRVAAGQVNAAPVGPGQCLRLYTGSPMPAGTDAVVMQEDVHTDPAQPDTVWFQERIAPGENVRRQGQDIQHGAVLLTAGQRVSAGQLCLLAATGVTRLRVGGQPTVGLLATGSELQEGGQPLAPGHIYECNRTALAALLPRSGARPRVYPLVPDNLEATRQALATAFAECEVVVTSGGVSVGEFDWVKAAFERLGGTLEFWRVAVKPGKPFVFGRWKDKHLYGLPGNPVSALVTFLLLVQPALARWQGATDLRPPTHAGILAQALTNRDTRPHFMRVICDDKGQVTSAGLQGSHILGSLAAANGLVEIPPAKTLPAGTPVQVIRW